MTTITADLSGKHALVTGAASGIGLASAEKLARAGAQVAINDLAGNPRLDKQVARLQADGLSVLAAPGNVGDPDDAGRMVTAAIEAMGGLDYLVNNAGTPGTKAVIPTSDLDRLDEAFWQRLLSVNLIGPFRCTHAAAAALKAARGAVVNTASIAAYRGGSSTTYSATKAGLVSLTRELAKGLAPEVRVNAIAPGFVGDSNWDINWGEGWEERESAKVPLGRVGRVEDYADAIFYLCAGAAYVTGQTLVVDGGLTC